MKYKLLIAQDDSAERSLLCSTLNTHFSDRINICEARNGTEALSLFSREDPRIAILDVEMSGIGGLSLAKSIRETNRPCSIIFLTSSDNVNDARQAIALRALDYLVKPCDTAKLMASVEEAIQITSRFFDGSQFSSAHHQRAETSHPEEAGSARITLVREDISAYIESHYMKELSMKNVAQAMNYSDAYFCKLFKQCFHVNFSTYLNEFRIKKAKEMMENPRINVKNISIACGYTDSNYFARVFKRVTGQTPSEYRLGIMEQAMWE